MIRQIQKSLWTDPITSFPNNDNTISRRSLERAPRFSSLPAAFGGRILIEETKSLDLIVYFTARDIILRQDSVSNYNLVGREFAHCISFRNKSLDLTVRQPFPYGCTQIWPLSQ
ncbi:hypothetical protein AVEN_106684-1 [Araneus ventricosus]|uniref:Uncharacterized protein n=1 Tax=Araneus ventricosus TaxID=182803 RepID=A0A4Y2KEU0_ARAVE|nr:hypothetical protein AVEN_106684-1 [Araneus ventricosus]